MELSPNPRSRIQVEWVGGYFAAAHQESWTTSASLYGDDRVTHRPAASPADGTRTTSGSGDAVPHRGMETRCRHQRLGRPADYLSLLPLDRWSQRRLRNASGGRGSPGSWPGTTHSGGAEMGYCSLLGETADYVRYLCSSPSNDRSPNGASRKRRD